MALLLGTAHTYSPGHGEPDGEFTHVVICEQRVNVLGQYLILVLQHGNIVNGAWESSPEPPFKLPRIQNKEALLTIEEMEIDDPDYEGDPPIPQVKAIQEVEVSAADPAFQNLREGFVIQAEDVGEEGYDVVAKALYQYLIDSGMYPNATIV